MWLKIIVNLIKRGNMGGGKFREERGNKKRGVVELEVRNGGGREEEGERKGGKKEIGERGEVDLMR